MRLETRPSIGQICDHAYPLLFTAAMYDQDCLAFATGMCLPPQMLHTACTWNIRRLRGHQCAVCCTCVQLCILHPERAFLTSMQPENVLKVIASPRPSGGNEC